MNRRVFQVMCAVLMVAMCFSVCYAAAQEGEGDKEVVKKSWFDLFKSTGLVGILLVLTSVIGTALLIQYLVNVNETKLGNPTLLSEVEALLSENDVDGAYTLAQSDQSYAGKVIAGAIGRSVGGYEEARKGAEEAAAVEGFRLNAKMSYLSLIGNIGPLLGLLGTVTGMITSFQKIETMKSPTPADLAVGVYESLVNTTMGLFIAIIFLSGYFFMKNKVSDLCLRINNTVGEILTRTLSPEAQKEAGR
jgi:biopolymer transport protein ExbB